MGKYLFATIASLGALVCSALASVAYAVGSRFAEAFDFAFPIAAVRNRMPIAALQSEAVTYATGLSRTRAFLARLAQRNDERSGFGVLGLPAAA